MSKHPSPRADQLRAMREAQFARYEQLQKEAEKSAPPVVAAKPASPAKPAAAAKRAPKKSAAKKTKAKTSTAKKKSGR